ncbi:peroxidase family protein (macronuclear) [Tetrahymena thermophila SB210]|uniref:Peroxidase family protein n=1 Tax=Tetrahymena thermophila (strain SB210) TaxID=312017 RepID=I7MLD5_TETTS|nr:peroxidase family protein [Tetrahymena thermophila SB210]EAS01806.2 peroxidase family protein [Tetrahymena thermophila SB210]|eukprot:XP_001022051.2 peroxidase family protein [Tetrahymena thermophila SB210]
MEMIDALSAVINYLSSLAYLSTQEYFCAQDIVLSIYSMEEKLVTSKNTIAIHGRYFKEDQNLDFIKQGGNLQFKKYLCLKGVKKFIFNKKFYSSEIVNRYRYLLEQKALKVISVEDLNEIQGDKQEEQIEETKVDLEKSEYVQHSFQESEEQSEIQSVSDQDNIINQLNEFQISNNAKQNASIYNINDLDSKNSNDLNKGLYEKNSSNIYEDKMVDDNCITLKSIKEEQVLQSQKISEDQMKQEVQEQQLHNISEKNIQLNSKNNTTLVKDQDQEKKNVQLLFNSSQDNKQQDLKPFQSVNSLSSSSTSSSSTKFVNTLSKSNTEDKQKLSKKEQIFGFFSKAKEKYQEAKVSLKESAKSLIYDINQKVHDPDTQIKIQMIKEDVRTKTMEAQEIIEEQATHFKDYATTTLESFKNKIKDKIKEKKIDKEIVDMKQQIREKYLEFEVYTENLASKKIKQIKNYLHTENIENEPFETIESDGRELDKSSQNLDKQNTQQKNTLVNSLQDIQTSNLQEEQKISINQISQNENDYLQDKYKKNINKQFNQNDKKTNVKQMNISPKRVLFIDEQHSYDLQQIQEDDSIFQPQEQNLPQYEEADNDEEEKNDKEEILVSNYVQKNNIKLNLVQDQKDLFNQHLYHNQFKCNQDKVLFLDECSQENSNNNKAHIQDDESIFDSFKNQNI